MSCGSGLCGEAACPLSQGVVCEACESQGSLILGQLVGWDSRFHHWWTELSDGSKVESGFLEILISLKKSVSDLHLCSTSDKTDKNKQEVVCPQKTESHSLSVGKVSFVKHLIHQSPESKTQQTSVGYGMVCSTSFHITQDLTIGAIHILRNHLMYYYQAGTFKTHEDDANHISGYELEQ